MWTSVTLLLKFGAWQCSHGHTVTRGSVWGCDKPLDFPHLPPTTGRTCSLCPTPTQTLRLCTDTSKQGKKNPSKCVGEKKNSNLQTVTAELCFSENYHKLIHPYLALWTKRIECPRKFRFYYLLPNQQAATTACPWGTDRHYLCPSHQSQGGEGWVSFLTQQLH